MSFIEEIKNITEDNKNDGRYYSKEFMHNLILSHAKLGENNCYVDGFKLNDEITQWLEEEGFDVTEISYEISADIMISW